MLSWSELESNVTWTERGGTFDTGSFTLKLGPRQEISDYEMYEVILNGDVGEYSPGWDFIGTDTYGGVYGLVDGIEGAVLLYSVIDSGVPRTGFYAKFAPWKMITTNRNARMIPGQYTDQVPHFEGNITGVGYSGGGQKVFQGTGCDYYPGVGTICGGGTTLGPSQDETHIEYWSADAGPIGMHYSYNFEDCLGAACNEKHIERRVEARYFGDFAGSKVGYENEPDTYADPTPIDVEGPIFTIMGEINEFDTPSGFIEGIEAPVGMALAAEIQDWYRFEVTAVEQDRVRDFYVLWNGPDVDLDVYLYSAPDNQPFGLLYLAEGEVLDDTLQFERGKFLSGSLAPGSYLIGVHLPNADQGPVPYGVISVRE